MAHLFAPQPANPELPVFFNVDGVVGALPSQNNREDVLLVQFAFHMIGSFPRPTTPPVLVAAAKAVALTGLADPATINAIRIFQQETRKFHTGTIVDGRVSPAKGGHDYGDAYWTISLLNNAIQERHVDIWPRIDKIPSCPGELKQMVMRTVAGT